METKEIRGEMEKKKANEKLVQKPVQLREGIKKTRFFLGYLSQMWVGGAADSQTRFKPLRPPQITPKIAFFDPNFTFRFPKSYKNTLGWVGW